MSVNQAIWHSFLLLFSCDNYVVSQKNVTLSKIFSEPSYFFFPLLVMLISAVPLASMAVIVSKLVLGSALVVNPFCSLDRSQVMFLSSQKRCGF